MALVRANFEFWAENQAELSFQVGDIIKVLNRDDEGWWEGELGGRRGLFPSNYVEPYTAINNYRAGGAQQQQPGWGNRSNVGGGSQVGGNRSVVNGGGSNVGNRSNMGNGSQVGNGMNNQQGWNNNNMNNNNNQRWDNGSQVGSNAGNRSNAGSNNNMNNNNQQGWGNRSNAGSNMGNNNNNQQGWNNNTNNNQQQQGWGNRSNVGSSVGNGSQTGLLNNRNNMGSSSSQVSNNRMNNNMGNGSQVGGRSNVGNGSQAGNNNWNNNMNNNNMNNNNNWNNNNTNNNNWNNNNMPMNNNQQSFQRDGNNEWGGNGNMKKPANLDTYNNIVNAFNNTNEPPRQATAQPKPTMEEPVKKPAAQPTNFAARPKVSPTKYGPWASNMGDITGMTMVGLGICSMVWSFADMAHFGPFPLWTGAYGIAMGVVICLFENSRWGQARGPSRVPWRAIAYLAISIFLFFSLPMLLTGLCCVLVAGVNLIATVKGEVYDAPAKQSHDSSADAGYFSNLYQYLISFREQNKIGVLVFVGSYFLGNLILFFVVLWQFIKIAATTEATNPGMATSYWIPYAKGFGNLLDMNCAFIVLPVCRTFLRMLYNRSTADQGLFARFLRGILYFIPIDKNIAFHKLIAKLIWMSAVGHTIAHFLNFAFTPTITFGIYGLSPFLTGGTLSTVILLIYSSARDNVRRGQFEIFWYNHHTFVIFFLANIFHGKGSIGPNYYKWFAIPGTIYLLERLLRIYRAYQKVVITSVTIMDDVLSIEIAKEGVFEAPYKEGQYIFLQSPPISQIQWHPFTISSAPQEQTVTVHIRVCGEGSWTKGLRDYLGSMGPKGRPYFQLDRQGPAGKLVGKIVGPDGQAMLRIDGPHSAPTQHLGEYSAAMISGAGIGVTPVASTLKSVVFHKWKYYIGQCFPDHAYFFWVCGHKDVNAFRWLIRHIKDAQDEVTHMRATNPQNMASKTFEFHIYVSSVPKDQKPVEVVVDDEIGFWGVPREDAKVDKVRCNWDEVDLYKTMLCPPAHTELGDVHVWNGRPAWDPRFAAVARNHPYMDIGVMFCGNPAIGRDLRRMCHIHSKGRTQGIFKLHKENF